MAKFEQVKKRLRAEWGLTLTRNDPTARGWWHGAWKSGYSVDGYLHGLRRYATLDDIIAMMDRSLNP